MDRLGGGSRGYRMEGNKSCDKFQKRQQAAGSRAQVERLTLEWEENLPGLERLVYLEWFLLQASENTIKRFLNNNETLFYISRCQGAGWLRERLLIQWLNNVIKDPSSFQVSALASSTQLTPTMVRGLPRYLLTTLFHRTISKGQEKRTVP